MLRDEKFPRSDSLPIQSPLFWVEQKDRYLRQLLIRDIEALTERRLVVYFANRYENAQIEPSGENQTDESPVVSTISVTYRADRGYEVFDSIH
jgi:hypothetical protein